MSCSAPVRVLGGRKGPQRFEQGICHQIWVFRMEKKWERTKKKNRYRPSMTESGAVGKSRSISISPSHPFTLFLRFRFGPGEIPENSIGEAGTSPLPALILATSSAVPSVWPTFGGKTERSRLDSLVLVWGWRYGCAKVACLRKRTMVAIQYAR